MPASGLAYEVVPGQAVTASAFMQGIAGHSDYAAALGANFSGLIAAKYLTSNSKTRRAFWINPAVSWSAADTAGTSKGRFALSQRVVVVALVHFVAGGVRRRGLLSAATTLDDRSAPATGSAAVEFGVGLGEALAAQLGLQADHVSTWVVGLALTAKQACMASSDLNAAARGLLLNYLSSSESSR